MARSGQARPGHQDTHSVTDGGRSNPMMATEIICTANSISRRAAIILSTSRTVPGTPTVPVRLAVHP